MQKTSFGKCLFVYQILLVVGKKNKKFFGPISKLLRIIFMPASKKCFSYSFHIWKWYDKHFPKKKSQFFSLQTVLLESNSLRN